MLELRRSENPFELFLSLSTRSTLTSVFASENNHFGDVTGHELNEIVEPRKTLMPRIKLGQRFLAETLRFFHHDGKTVVIESLQNIV